MMTHLERVKQLREDPKVHYNCCQSVLIPYCEDLGLGLEVGNALAAHFGSGMRMGGTCGAITGGLMALGLMGAGEEKSRAFLRHFREAHQATDCAALLRLDRERGNSDKKAHCDGLVYEAVELVDALLRED